MGRLGIEKRYGCLSLLNLSKFRKSGMTAEAAKKAYIENVDRLKASHS